MSTPLERLRDATKELVDSVDFDVNGALIGGKWMGGHGGLVSKDTIAKADAVRRALAALPKAEEAKGP